MTSDADSPGNADIDPVVAEYISNPIRLSFTGPDDPLLKRSFINMLEKRLGVRSLVQMYSEIKSESRDPGYFFTAALDKAGIVRDYDDERIALIPDSGPLVFVANHPYGVVDGLMLCELAMRVRGDFRIMLHSFLCQDEDLAAHFLPVDFAENRRARNTNMRVKALVEDAVRDGIPLVLFPSGTVTTRSHFGLGPGKEPPWRTFFARLVLQTEATVIPVYFHGMNSRLYHFISHFSQVLREAMGLRELRRQFGKAIDIEIGEPITPEDWGHCDSRLALTRFLEAKTLALKDRRHH